MWKYDEIKEEARSRGCSVNDLIALAAGNDPFYIGRPSDVILAEWFSNLWHTFGYGTGVHIRRVHYQIISQDPPVKLPNGEPYENTEKCWDILSQAAKCARYLEMVDPAAFDDRRNPEAIVNAPMNEQSPMIYIDDRSYSSPSLPDFPNLPDYWVSGYDARQRYMLEIWAEKSTMNDVLRPLCEAYGANLQTGLGELSITATLNAVNRVIRAGRPTRIFYVSDFDPAGQSMPVAVARKIEYFVRSSPDDLDIRLYPVVLTADQVQMYDLPRTPIKESEKRATRFEDRFGTGAVELDALEALHPGTLADILRGHLDEFFDHELDDRVAEARANLADTLESARQAVIAPHQDTIDQLRAQYADIRQRFETEIATFAAEQRRLWQAITSALVRNRPDIDDHPIPEADESTRDWHDDALYDTGRGYMDQIASYKTFQGREPVDA